MLLSEGLELGKEPVLPSLAPSFQTDLQEVSFVSAAQKREIPFKVTCYYHVVNVRVHPYGVRGWSLPLRMSINWFNLLFSGLSTYFYLAV